MKNFLFSFIAIVVFSGCGVSQPAVNNLSDSFVMHVEFTRDAGTRNSVMMILRHIHANNVREEQTGSVVTIEAAYAKTNEFGDKLEDMGDELRRLPMVMLVEVRDDWQVER